MKKWPIYLAVLLLFQAVTTPVCFAGNSEFRGKWWHYYERGISAFEQGESDNAIGDLKKAMSKREKDQRMARTYGMNFIDYFPHRELGIVYLAMGNIDAAIAELEESIRQQESAKGVYFLNKARKALLQGQGGKADPPLIAVITPAPEAALKDARIRVKGKVVGNGYISRILVNNSAVDFDLARQEIEFDKEIEVNEIDSRIMITAEDLLGNVVTKSLTVHVDAEGPLIAIIDVVTREESGKKYLKITGDVSDATGIKTVAVNDRMIDVRNAQTFALEIEEQRGKSDRLSIRAWDSLDNMTVAEIDPERELVAFSRKPEPVLLAFNSPRIFSSDRERPLITLKDGDGLPDVFVDKYYVDGEVYDNDRVDRILINNKELPVKKGKKIFFGRLLKLNEGKNRINVTSYDAVGNKGTTEFTVTRKVPSVMQNGSRMSISVLPFAGEMKDSDYTILADDFLAESFVEQKRFMVIEREKLKQVLAEQKLSKEKLTDPEHSLRLGRLIAADAIVATSVREMKKSLEIIARVINTETSEIMHVRDIYVEDKAGVPVRELMAGLATKIASGFPLSEGMVIKTNHADIYTDLGSAAVLHKGMGVIIYKQGQVIKHPVTGRSLGAETIKLAEGRVEEVQKDFSKVKLLDKYKKQEIKPSNLIIMK